MFKIPMCRSNSVRYKMYTFKIWEKERRKEMCINIFFTVHEGSKFMLCANIYTHTLCTQSVNTCLVCVQFHILFCCNHGNRASMIWIIGEYAERIDNADELLESFMEGFHDENTQVQLALLTAIVKLFLKRPTETQELVQQVLSLATQVKCLCRLTRFFSMFTVTVALLSFCVELFSFGWLKI